MPSEAEIKERTIDFRAVDFPEKDIVEMAVTGKDGKSYKLSSYRYPVPEGVQRKGVIVFVHGYGDYVGRYAFKGKFIAQHGYDFVGVDQRGFGHSQGHRGYIEDHQMFVDEQVKFVEAIKQKYTADSETPMFLFGHSLGGLLSLFTYNKKPELFKGVALLSPYLALYDE